MNTNEIATISATFASSLWINPRSGEARLYVNNLPQGSARVFITRDESGSFEVGQNDRDAWNWNRDMAYEAVDNALINAGLPLNASFDQIVATITAQEEVEVEVSATDSPTEAPSDSPSDSPADTQAITSFVDSVVAAMDRHDPDTIDRAAVVEDIFTRFAESGEPRYEVRGYDTADGCPMVLESAAAYAAFQCLTTYHTGDF